MNPKSIRLFALFAFVVPVFTGCLTNGQISDLDAEAKNSTPELIKLTQMSVLEHMNSIHHVSIPATEEWRADASAGSNGEYCFRSGGWKMVIYPATDKGNQRVVVIDAESDTFWCGSVEPDGDIADTCLMR